MLELVGSELVKRAAERAARREERLKQAREGPKAKRATKRITRLFPPSRFHMFGGRWRSAHALPFRREPILLKIRS